ncbi:TlpA family protein disulfide reductase [Bacillus megaterium]|nr:TlpA family protein disulfide reductase [Priestia megaterium]
MTLPTLGGEPVKLSDLRGKAVVLNFWTSWCPPCKKEMPELEKFTNSMVVKSHCLLFI